MVVKKVSKIKIAGVQGRRVVCDNAEEGWLLFY